MKAGDKIRVQKYMMGKAYDHEDYTVEEFRHCLGVFLCHNDRTASRFTPLCYLYEPAPDAIQGYIGNYGEYYDKWVPAYMNLPNPPVNDKDA